MTESLGRGIPTSTDFLAKLEARKRTDQPPLNADRMGTVDGARAQRELVGVFWDASAVDWSRIRRLGVDVARARFRSTLPDLIWNAGALEGNAFTLPEVRTLLDGITVAGHKLRDEEQILALSEGYSYIDELVRDGKFAPTKEISDRVHALIARHEAIESGNFRGEGTPDIGGSVSLAAGGYVPWVPEGELAERWAALEDYLDHTDDARVRALVYNASATRTQYYFDGNKRTARLMMTGILLTAGYDAINIPHARRLEYNLALDELFTTDDATALLAFIASCAHNPDRP